MSFLGKILGDKKLETGLDKESEKANVQAPASRGSGTFLVMDVYSIAGIGIVPVGKVISGTLRPGQTTIINGKTATIKTIEARHQQLAVAQTGENIGMSLKGIEKNDIQKGMTLEFH